MSLGARLSLIKRTYNAQNDTLHVHTKRGSQSSDAALKCTHLMEPYIIRSTLKIRHYAHRGNMADGCTPMMGFVSHFKVHKDAFYTAPCYVHFMSHRATTQG